MIEFAGATFESVEDIRKRFESIRDLSPLREPLQGTEHKMVMKLLQAHPRYKEKIGPGISALTVDFHPDFKTTRVFTVVRIDKLKEDFSFQKPWKKLRATLVEAGEDKRPGGAEETPVIRQIPELGGPQKQKGPSSEKAKWIAKLESRVTAAENALAGIRKVIAEFKE